MTPTVRWIFLLFLIRTTEVKCVILSHCDEDGEYYWTSKESAVENPVFQMSTICSFSNECFKENCTMQVLITPILSDSNCSLTPSVLKHLQPNKPIFVDNAKINILSLALQKNCSSVAEQLLAIGADPYLQDSSGETSLHMAVKKENIPIVLLILKNNKAGINKQNASNETALILASKLNNSEIFRIILKGNADPLIWTSKKYTPLHFASLLGNTEIASAVLQKYRWFINLQATGGFTPLFLAAEADMASFLLENGAQPYIPSDSLGTALHKAVFLKNVRIVEQILKKSAGGINFIDSAGNTAILIAAHTNVTEIYCLLLEAGADPFLPSKSKRTALHEAVINSNMPMIEVTLKKTTKGINQQDKFGVSALLIAARQKKHKISEILLKSGSDPSIADYKHNLTPLHLCAKNGDLAAVKMILKQVPGIINAKSKSSVTPLYIATRYSHVQVAKYLISQGADSSISDRKMWTPLHVCAGQNLREIAEAILSSNKTVMDMQTHQGLTALHVAVLGNTQDVIRVLVQNKAAILPDMLGLTPLHIAAGLFGSVPLLRQLLDAYENAMDIANSYGNTPLHEAASHNMTESAVMLLESGAKTNITNNLGETPLYFAVREKNERLVLYILIHSKPNVISITNNVRHNALILAFENDYNIFKMILNRCPRQFVTSEVLDMLFIRAASISKLGELKLVLERFPESIHYMSRGYNVLHYAVQYCYEDMINYLLRKGADVTSLSVYERTPLHLAANNCNFSVFLQVYNKSEEKLKAKNSSIKYILDQPDITGFTPIHWAAMSGNKEIFRFLWRKGRYSDSSARDYLFLAACGGNADIIQDILRKSNGPVDMISSDGSTPLMYAALTGREAAFHLLLANGAQLGVTNKYGHTILLFAASSRPNSIIDAVLKQTDINVNAVDVEGYTPLMTAAARKNLHALQELLLREADQDIVNIYGENAVTLAVKSGFWKALELLNYAEYDSDVILGIALGRKELPKKEILSDLLNKSSISKDPLFYAAAVGDDLEVQNLLAHSSRIKRRRFPSIFKEFLQDYIEYMLQFEDYDSDPLYEHHVSLLDISLIFSESLKTVRRIIEKTRVNCSSIIYRDKMFTPIDFTIFHWASNQGTELLDYLFKLCDCCLHRATNKHGWTLAHKAAWLENWYALGILKKRGVDLDKPDAYGRTPLHIAAIRGHFNTVMQILFSTKKSVNVSDIHGFTPLHLAIMYKYGGFFKRLSTATISMPPSEKYKFIQKVKPVKSEHKSVVDVLLEYQSPLDVQDKAFGWTPLHWAAVNGDGISAVLLVYYGARLNIPSWTGQTPMAVARAWGRTDIYDYLKKKNGVW